MRACSTILFLALHLAVTLGVGAQVAGQGFLLSRTDGTQIAGQPYGMSGAGADRQLQFRSAGGSRTDVPLAEVLGLQGPTPRVRAAVAVYLHGGDEWKGELAGGDELGDHFVLQSGTLRTQKIPVDRLHMLVFRERAVGVGPEAFALAADAKYDEALFGKASRGFDVMGGALERFKPDGVHFVFGSASVPRLFRYETLSALTIRGGTPAAKPGDWLLITVSGDRLRVKLEGVTETEFWVETEFGAVALPQAQVAAMTRLDPSRIYLSDLAPQRVEEAGSASDFGAQPLFTFRRDRTVSGGVLRDSRSLADGFLVADGHTYGKGLGVHSRCALTYRVPAKMTRFHARVAIDDEVKSLGVKGDVDVRVRAGEALLFEKKGLQRGQPPQSLGLLEVQPGTLLTLEVDFGKGLFLGDRVDWLSAVFLLGSDGDPDPKPKPKR